MQSIPFDSLVPDCSFSVDLGSKQVDIRLTWNDTAQSWYMEVGYNNQVMIAGMALVPNWLLMNGSKASGPVEGDFICTRLSSLAPDKIGYADLGVTWGLCWMNETELTAWKVFYGLE